MRSAVMALRYFLSHRSEVLGNPRVSPIGAQQVTEPDRTHWAATSLKDNRQREPNCAGFPGRRDWPEAAEKPLTRRPKVIERLNPHWPGERR
jgi:hypothetical protein